MEYYVYVSDTKVDMLYFQIPSRALDTVAAELKIDLKVLSTTFSKNASEATRFSKLKVVTEYINKHEQVGTVDSPAGFFRGTMPLRWGTYRHRQRDLQVALFAGHTELTMLALGGSLKHVIGGASPTARQDFLGGLSTLPFLMAVLGRRFLWSLLGEEATTGDVDAQRSVSAVEKQIQGLMRKLGTSAGRQHALRSVAFAAADMEGSTQNMHFLAKRLLQGYDRKLGVHVLLGNPIYVALAE